MTRSEPAHRLKAVGAAAFALALALASPVLAQWRGGGHGPARGGGRGEAYQERGGGRMAGQMGGPMGARMGDWGGGRPDYGARGFGGGFREGGYGRGGYDGAARGGPPPGGPRAWRRGETLPDGYRGATVPDPGRYHLRRPPNGYDWVGDNRNAYLMQRSTGMVLDSVPGAYEPPPPYRGRRR